MKYIFFLFGLTAIFAASLCKSIKVEGRHGPPHDLISIQKVTDLMQPEERALELEERDEPRQHRSGIIRILENVTVFMQTVLQFLDGHKKIPDIVDSVQQVFYAVEGFVNIKAIIREFPIIGPIVATIVGPILDLMASLIQNTPVFGNLISQLIVGPEYPVTLPPPPPPPPTTQAPKGIFGSFWAGPTTS